MKVVTSFLMLIVGLVIISSFKGYLLPEFEKPVKDVLNGFQANILKGIAPKKTGTVTNQQEPRMELEALKTKSMMVLTIVDTAKTMADIGPSLAKDYAEIGSVMKMNQLNYAGMPLAWYHSQIEPYLIEAGIPVDKKPAKLSGRVKIKQVEEGTAVVVHFWGPYEMTAKAYPMIKKWLEQNNKTAAGAPYDVYVSDPTTVKDPYQIQTDIYQPFK